MKVMFTNILVSVLAFAAAGGAQANAAQAGSVSVSISGVRAENGPLYVSLQTETQFLKEEGSYGKIVARPEAGTLSVTLPNVPPGEYSVTVWHDIDGDGVFDRAENGIPLDGWSMLNAGALRGQPKFDDVKFTVTASGAAISLDMIYAN